LGVTLEERGTDHLKKEGKKAKSGVSGNSTWGTAGCWCLILDDCCLERRCLSKTKEKESGRRCKIPDGGETGGYQNGFRASRITRLESRGNQTLRMGSKLTRQVEKTNLWSRWVVEMLRRGERGKKKKKKGRVLLGLSRG